MNLPATRSIKFKKLISIVTLLTLWEQGAVSAKTRIEPIDRMSIIRGYRNKIHLADEKFGAFSQAVSNGEIDTVRKMLRRGAKINGRNGYGLTPLMVAAQYARRSDPKMTAFLISKGARVNDTSLLNGDTPLMFASCAAGLIHEDENVKIIKILLKNGAKLRIRNKFGETALDIAKQCNARNIIKVLKKAYRR